MVADAYILLEVRAWDIAHLVGGYEATRCPASTSTSFYCGRELPESDEAAAIAVP